MEAAKQAGNQMLATRHRATPRRFRRIFCSQSGQSLVELGLLMPVLLVLVLGTIDMGRYASQAIVVGNAARAGAAYGSQNSTKAKDQSGIQTAALNDAQNISGLTITSTFVCGCDNGGTITPAVETNAACGTTCAIGAHLVVFSQVTAQGTFSPLINWPGIPSSVVITSTATVRVGQ